MNRQISRVSRLGVVVLALLCASCSNKAEERLPTEPVTGSLRVNDQPAAGATVKLHPVNAPDLGKYSPFAHVKEDGTFEFLTYETGDGVPAGEYVMTVVWHPGGVGSRDVFAGKYKDPNNSTLKITISEGNNTLKPIDLKVPGARLPGSAQSQPPAANGPGR